MLQRQRLRVREAKESAQGSESAWRYHPVTRRHRHAAHTRQECADLHLLQAPPVSPFLLLLPDEDTPSFKSSPLPALQRAHVLL